jgi:hypothetical protein
LNVNRAFQPFTLADVVQARCQALMELASSPRLPPGDGSLRSKQQMTTTGEPSLRFRLAFLVIPSPAHPMGGINRLLCRD